MRAIAYAVVAFALLAGVLSLVRSGARRRAGGIEPIPPSMRPSGTDDVLETDRISGIIRWGLGTVVFMSVFIPVYWFAEPGRQKGVDQKFLDNSIRRGASYFALRTDPVTGEENLSGVECARCHGVDATGGQNTFTDSRTSQRRTVQVPELKHVFARYEQPPPGYKDAQTFIMATIERGRTDGVIGVGDDMPIWGNQYGGPLTEQQVEDIVNYLITIQATGEEEQADAGPPNGQTIFAQFCATCHGPNGTGGQGPAMTGGAEVAQFANIEDHVAFVKAGSKPGTPYGKSGKGTGAMPAWESSLSDAQIRAVVEYERSL